MPKITLQNRQLYYEQHGAEGPPLLLLAGLGCDHSMWEEVLPALKEKFSVYVLDNRASGQSDGGESFFTIKDMAQDARDLLDHLEISSCYVVGHSMGGAIALALALFYPEKVSKLAICASDGGFSLRTHRVFEVAVRLLEAGVSIDLCIENIFQWFYSSEFLSDPAHIEKEKKKILSNPFPQSLNDYVAQVRALNAYDLRDQVNQVKQKTLVLAGEEDLLATPQETRELAECLVNSKYVLLPHAGHCLVAELPHLFCEEIIQFD